MPLRPAHPLVPRVGDVAAAEVAVEQVLRCPAHPLVPRVGDLALVRDAPEAYAAVESTVLDLHGVNPVEVRNGYHRLFEDGWAPALTISQHSVHPPHPERPDLSLYSVLHSVSASHFIREEWYSMDVLHRNAVGWEDDYADPEGWGENTFGETGFHETTFIQFLSILKAGGFVPGPGTHRRGRVSCKGAFCCKEMGLCLGRADLSRAKDLHGNMRACTFPVILELECVQLKKISNIAFCARGNVGVLHPGVRIRKVHFSMLRMQRFQALGSPEVQARWHEIIPCGSGASGWDCRSMVSCCGAFTHIALPTHPWNPAPCEGKWTRSNSGLFYCPRCYVRNCRGGGVV